MRLNENGKRILSEFTGTENFWELEMLYSLINAYVRAIVIEERRREISVVIPTRYVNLLHVETASKPSLKNLNWYFAGSECGFVITLSSEEHFESFVDEWLVCEIAEPQKFGCYLVKNESGQIRSMQWTDNGWTHPEFGIKFWRDLV